jgi:RimJ/RimL family protein N-acetyltransferase
MDDSPKTRLPLVVGELTLRRFEPNDLYDLREYWADPEVMRYNWGPSSDEQIGATIAAQAEIEVGGPGAPLYLAVVLNKRVIGDCQLTIVSLDDRQGAIGFTFHPFFTGRGYATRSVVAALGFGFVQLDLHRIDATTDVRNERSWRLMERVGMRREAHFVHSSYINGEWIDDYVYAMLDSEWRSRYPELLAVVEVGNGSQG